MNSKRGSTLRAQWLGRHLRRLRESTGLTLRDVADHVLRNAPAIGRIEQGASPPRVPEVVALLDLYRIDDQVVRSALEDLSRGIWRKCWWDGYVGFVPEKIIDLAWLESHAEKFRDFSALVLHPLLQIPDYTKAVMAAANKGCAEDDLDMWLEFRSRRQEIFERDNPPEYAAILDEGALRRAVGGSEVMKAQLAHLLDLADRPTITLRVLPFSAGAPANPDSAFTHLTMPRPFSNIVHLNTEADTIYLETPDADRFAEAHLQLESDALDVDDSRTWIKTRMERMT